jgi:peptidoglycan/LPS O-acetylase OafA/YrhL
MQFYAVFPLAMLLLRKTRWLPGAALIALGGFVVAKAVQAAHIDFPMPSFLPLKMHVFLCGMLIANGLFVTPRQTVMNGLLAVMLVMIPIGGDMTSTKVAVRLLLVVGFFVLVHYHLLPGLVGKLGDRVSSLMGNHFCHWLGELSFGVYLIHLLLLQPLAAFVITHFGAEISAPARFAIVVAALLPLAYALAYLGFTRIEGPGQTLGRKVLEIIRRRRLKPA